MNNLDEKIKEVWREVEGYNGVYFVSNIGTVKSIDHYCEGRKGSGKQNGRVLKLQKCRKGYLRVCLCDNKKKFTTGAHRLVAKAFILNPMNKAQVNHINCIKDDNRVENLEWCTNTENRIHAIANGLQRFNYSEGHHNSKLTNKEVVLARKLNKEGFSLRELANKYNVSKTAMHKIVNKLTYKTVK
jgi:hypothetical protein